MPTKTDDSTRAKELGLLIATERGKRIPQFSQRALADAADVSITYLAEIERGTYQKSGKPVEPSPNILRRIARALAQGREGEEEQLYTRFMEAAGYLPGVIAEWYKPTEEDAWTREVLEMDRKASTEEREAARLMLRLFFKKQAS